MTNQFTHYETDIKPEWIDYNEHLNDAAYAIVLSQANEDFLRHLNLSDQYRVATKCSMYTVEMLISYQAEVHQSDHLKAKSWISELAPKKVRIKTELIRKDGTVAATGQVLYLHFDGETQKVSPFSETQFSQLESFRHESDSQI